MWRLRLVAWSMKSDASDELCLLFLSDSNSHLLLLIPASDVHFFLYVEVSSGAKQMKDTFLAMGEYNKVNPVEDRKQISLKLKKI